MSYYDYYKKPSIKTFGYLMLDVGLCFVPFVPNKGSVKIASKTASAADKIVTTNRIHKNIEKGKQAEKAVSTYLDLKKNTIAYDVFGNSRIPDFMDARNLYEVKNVKKLSYTSHLRDYKKLADSMNMNMEIFVNPGTKISKPLIDSGINIRWDVQFWD